MKRKSNGLFFEGEGGERKERKGKGKKRRGKGKRPRPWGKLTLVVDIPPALAVDEVPKSNAESVVAVGVL